MLFWASHDEIVKGQALPDNINEHLRDAAAAHTGNINSICYFFEGMEYLFVDSTASNVGRTKNSVCIGVSIVLDSREKDHDGEQPFRILKYLPLAIWVKPKDVNVGDVCGDLGPSGCIPIKKCSTGIVELKLPHAHGDTAHSIKFTRWGIPLGDAYAVSDYYCEGASFKDDCWIADMMPPADGPFVRASVFVILSRFKSLNNFRALRRLWPKGDDIAKQRIVGIYQKTAIMSTQLRAELARLDELEIDTLKRHANLFHTLRIAPSDP